MTSEEFDKLHPYPDENNVGALFRFMSINPEDPKFIEHLFLQKNYTIH